MFRERNPMLPQAIAEDPRYANRLIAIESPEAIPESWRGTPIEKLILSENFSQQIDDKSLSGTPQLLIASCIEFRYALPIPRMFAYVIRRASGRLQGSEFSLAYVLAQGVRHIALIGHNDCGMTKVDEKAKDMIAALVEQGWNEDRASEYIMQHASRYKMADEIDALEFEYRRLKRLFRNVTIAPLFVCLTDTRLYIPSWWLEKKAMKGNEAAVPDEELLMLQP